MLKILKIFLFLFSIVIIIEALCPEESLEWQSYCFFFQNESISFTDAELNCVSSFDGHLPSIHDGFSNAWLAQNGKSHFNENNVTDFWIGLTDLLFPRNWTWTDGTDLDFTDWAKPLKLQNITENCAALSTVDSRWITGDCFKTKQYVCQVDKSFFEENTTPTPPNCTPPFTYFEPTNSCYGLKTEWGNSNWTQAEEYYVLSGGHLASIHSSEELTFLESYEYKLPNAIWSGAYSNDGRKSWKWSDESPWDFDPWFTGYPRMNSTACGMIIYYGLYDNTCDNEVLPICKIPLN